MKRPSLKKIAEKTNYSLRTIFRVLNNDPAVKAETREKVVRVLNIHGYCVEYHTGQEKVVVDVSCNSIFTDSLADEIIARLRLENYNTVKTYSWREPEKFRRELTDANIVIFTEHPKLDWNQIAREINPEIFRVSIFGENSENSELYIAADNLGSARSAVRYFCEERKCKNIAVICSAFLLDSQERAQTLRGGVENDFPLVHCKLLQFHNEQEILNFYHYFGAEWDGIFYTNGYPWVLLAPLLQRDRKNPVQVLFNDPDLILKMCTLPPCGLKLDAYIKFSRSQIREFVAFYLRNRPLLKDQPRLITLLPTEFRTDWKFVDPDK